MSRFTVRGCGRSFSVFCDNTEIAGPFVSRNHALERLEKEKRRTRQKSRHCITCGQSFLSDGPGNRMCDKCRECPSASVWDLPAQLAR